MTKEELEKEAREYGKKATAWLEDREPLDQRDIENAYLAGAEPREKRIADLEEQLANADYQLEGRDNEIRELKEQIEKMKCCGNCRFSESDKLNGTFCHREGCFVVASAKCKLWEN